MSFTECTGKLKCAKTRCRVHDDFGWRRYVLQSIGKTRIISVHEVHSWRMRNGKGGRKREGFRRLINIQTNRRQMRNVRQSYLIR